MTSQTSKAALRSLDRTEFLVMSTRTQKPNVSIRLTQVFIPALTGADGEVAPTTDWDLVQESHAGLLETSAAEVQRTDKAHRVNKVKMSEMRRKRRKLVAGLTSRHRDLRSSFTGTYGKDALPLVGLDATPERRFLAVREQQLEILERLRDPELASRLPEPRGGQAALDLTALADAIETEILELEVAMEAIQRMQKQVDESLVVKRETLRQHRRLYVNVARIQESYYRLAGLDELADRIRSPAFPRRKPPEQVTSEAGKRNEAPDAQPGDSQEESEDSEEVADSSSPEISPPGVAA